MLRQQDALHLAGIFQLALDRALLMRLAVDPRIADSEGRLLGRRAKNREVVSGEMAVLVTTGDDQDAQVFVRVAQRRKEDRDVVGIAGEGITKRRVVFHIPHMDRLAHAQAIPENSLVRGDTGQAQVTFQSPRIALGLFADFHRDPDERRALLGDVGWIEKIVVTVSEVDRTASRGDHLVDAVHDDAGEQGW